MLLNRQQILDAKDLKREVVDVPEWGDDAQVSVSMLPAIDKDRWDKESFKNGAVDMIGFKARFITRTIVDENGDRVFSDEDAPHLERKSAPAVDRVFAVAARLNGMLAKQVDEIEKKSEAVPAASSPGDLLGSSDSPIPT